MTGTATNPSGMDIIHRSLFERASHFDHGQLNPIRRRHAPLGSSGYVVVGIPDETPQTVELYERLEVKHNTLSGDIFAGTIDSITNEVAKSLNLNIITGRVALVGMRDFSVNRTSEDGDEEDVVTGLNGIRFVGSSRDSSCLDLGNLGPHGLPEDFDIIASYLSEDGSEQGIVAKRYYNDPVILTRDPNLAQSYAGIILDCV